MKNNKAIWGMLAGAATAALASAYVIYRRERQAALTDIRDASELIETRLGVVQVAEIGQGPAVLLLHGGGGGYDNALAFAFPGWGYRFIGISRPGYLDTSIQQGGSLEDEADLYAALLDELGVRQVAVVGMSGSGPAAITFASRYPERVWSLVLLSAISGQIQQYPPVMELVKRAAAFTDFIPWLVLNTPIFWLVDMLQGGKLSTRIKNNPEKESMLAELRRTLFPLGPRMPGAWADLEHAAQAHDLPLEMIKAPTLVIHGDSDSIVPYEHAQRSAWLIPNVEHLCLQGADHLGFITHLEITSPRLENFLRRYAPED